MITRKFNKELGILEVCYTGKLSYKELKNFGDSLTIDKSIPRELKILTDVREGEYSFTEKEVPKVIIALNEQIKAFKYIKAAFIQTKPRETAISLITEEKNTIPNYFHRVFSTHDAALGWLMGNNIQS